MTVVVVEVEVESRRCKKMSPKDFIGADEHRRSKAMASESSNSLCSRRADGVQALARFTSGCHIMPCD